MLSLLPKASGKVNSRKKRKEKREKKIDFRIKNIENRIKKKDY